MELFVVLIGGFVLGIVFSIFVAAHFLTAEDKEVEERRIWMNKNRVYRLVPLEGAVIADDRGTDG